MAQNEWYIMPHDLREILDKELPRARGKDTGAQKPVSLIDRIAIFTDLNRSLEVSSIKAALDFARARIGDFDVGISELEREIVAYRKGIKKEEQNVSSLEKQAKAIKKPEPVSPQSVIEDIERIQGLKFVASVKEGEGSSLIIRTKPDSLFVTLSTSFLEGGIRDVIFPVRVALPEYEILVDSGEIKGSLSNSKALRMRVADWDKYCSAFEGRDFGFNHQVNPHFATSHTMGPADWAVVCLGSYEADVCGAFRRSLSDGLVSLALMLQTTGDHATYVKKDRWSLWMGNPVYNAVILR